MCATPIIASVAPAIPPCSMYPGLMSVASGRLNSSRHSSITLKARRPTKIAGTTTNR